MDQWWWFLCGICLFWVFLLVPWWLQSRNRKVDWLLRHIDTPDRALAIFALLVTAILVFQQATNYQHGLVYQLSGDNVQYTIDHEQEMSVVFREQGEGVEKVYWILAILLLFSIAALVRGILQEKQEKETIKAMRPLIENNTEALNRLTKFLEEKERGGKQDGEHKPD
jgi:hypothetical protein